jgi:hypothetical protein
MPSTAQKPRHFAGGVFNQIKILDKIRWWGQIICGDRAGESMWPWVVGDEASVVTGVRRMSAAVRQCRRDRRLTVMCSGNIDSELCSKNQIGQNEEVKGAMLLIIWAELNHWTPTGELLISVDTLQRQRMPAWHPQKWMSNAEKVAVASRRVTQQEQARRFSQPHNILDPCHRFVLFRDRT